MIAHFGVQPGSRGWFREQITIDDTVAVEILAGVQLMVTVGILTVVGDLGPVGIEDHIMCLLLQLPPGFQRKVVDHLCPAPGYDREHYREGVVRRQITQAAGTAEQHPGGVIIFVVGKVNIVDIFGLAQTVKPLFIVGRHGQFRMEDRTVVIPFPETESGSDCVLMNTGAVGTEEAYTDK